MKQLKNILAVQEVGKLVKDYITKYDISQESLDFFKDKLGYDKPTSREQFAADINSALLSLEEYNLSGIKVYDIDSAQLWNKKDTTEIINMVNSLTLSDMKLKGISKKIISKLTAELTLASKEIDVMMGGSTGDQVKFNHGTNTYMLTNGYWYDATPKQKRDIIEKVVNAITKVTDVKYVVAITLQADDDTDYCIIDAKGDMYDFIITHSHDGDELSVGVPTYNVMDMFMTVITSEWLSITVGKNKGKILTSGNMPYKYAQVIEKNLKINIGPQLKGYLESVGMLTVDHYKWYGYNYSAKNANTFMNNTIDARKSYNNFPKNYMVIGNDGKGDLLCIDNNDIMYWYVHNNHTIEETGDTFLEHLIKTITPLLKNV